MPIELPPGTASYSDRSPSTKNRHILLIIGFLVGLIFAFFWSLDILVNGLVSIVPPSVEQQLGAITTPGFEQMAKPSPAQDALNQLLDRLEAKLPVEQREAHTYKVLFIPSETVNAVAVPGDRIIIYAGLLAQVKSENELMMVLGHELGHFAHRDHLRGLGRDLMLRLVFAIAFGDTGAFQSVALSAVNSVGNAQFSQRQEYQADDFGLDLLNATYGQVAGATDFFERMSQKEGVNIAFLATHPASKKRVSRLQKAIADRGYAIGERSPLPSALTNIKPR